MPNPPDNQAPGNDAPSLTLDEAIDALIKEADAACDRFESPDRLAFADDDGSSVEGMVDEEADETADATAEVESAMEQVEASANDLLEQAADELAEALDGPLEAAESIEQIEATEAEANEDNETDEAGQPDEAILDAVAEIADADASGVVAVDDESVAEAADEAIPDSEELIEGALDHLLGDEEEAGVEDAAAPVEAETDAVEASDAVVDELVEEAGSKIEDAVGDLLGDEVIDGTAEEPAAVEEDTPEANAEPADEADPLDGDAFDALLDGEEVPEPAVTEAAEPGDADELGSVADALMDESPVGPDTSSQQAVNEAVDDLLANEGAEIEPAAAEPEPEPVAAVETNETARSEAAADGSGGLFSKMTARARSLWVWTRPKAQVAGRHAGRIGGPIGARALVLLSKPLEGRPPKVRDSIGWVALWTVFLACCVWGYLVLRSPAEQPNDGNGSAIASAEGGEADG